MLPCIEFISTYNVSDKLRTLNTVYLYTYPTLGAWGEFEGVNFREGFAICSFLSMFSQLRYDYDIIVLYSSSWLTLNVCSLAGSTQVNVQSILCLIPCWRQRNLCSHVGWSVCLWRRWKHDNCRTQMSTVFILCMWVVHMEYRKPIVFGVVPRSFEVNRGQTR